MRIEIPNVRIRVDEEQHSSVWLTRDHLGNIVVGTTGEHRAVRVIPENLRAAVEALIEADEDSSSMSNPAVAEEFEER